MNDAQIRAERARQLIEDEILTDALARVENEAIEEMLSVPWWNVRKLSQHAARVRAVRDTKLAIAANIHVAVNTAFDERRKSTVA